MCSRKTVIEEIQKEGVCENGSDLIDRFSYGAASLSFTPTHATALLLPVVYSALASVTRSPTCFPLFTKILQNCNARERSCQAPERDSS